MLIAAIVGFLFGSIGSIPVAGPISALVLTRAPLFLFQAVQAALLPELSAQASTSGS